MDIKDKNQTNEQELVNLFQQDIFKILKESIRIEIIKYLAFQGPSDISTIANNFNQDRSVISRHLKIMKESGILIMTKSSRRSIYEIDGIAFLFKMESIVDDIKEVLSYTCKETFHYLYDNKMSYQSYLKQIENEKNSK